MQRSSVLCPRSFAVNGFTDPAKLLVGRPRNLDDRHRYPTRGHDGLHGNPVAVPEHRPQRFMTPHNFIETSFYRRIVQPARQSQAETNIVNRLAGLQLLEKPESLLPKRQRSFRCVTLLDRRSYPRRNLGTLFSLQPLRN